MTWAGALAFTAADSRVPGGIRRGTRCAPGRRAQRPVMAMVGPGVVRCGDANLTGIRYRIVNSRVAGSSSIRSTSAVSTRRIFPFARYMSLAAWAPFPDGGKSRPLTKRTTASTATGGGPKPSASFPLSTHGRLLAVHPTRVRDVALGTLWFAQCRAAPPEGPQRQLR